MNTRDYWAVRASNAAERPRPRLVRYGVVPSGFVAAPALPLVPGQYEVEVFVENHATLSYFTVNPDGTVSP